jgi:hypothetical protein
MFRRLRLPSIPESIHRIPAPDHMWNILLAQEGLLLRLADCCSVRRVHPGGFVSMASDGDKYSRSARTMQAIAELVPSELAVRARRTAARHLLGSVTSYRRQRDYRAAASAAVRLLRAVPSAARWR